MVVQFPGPACTLASMKARSPPGSLHFLVMDQFRSIPAALTLFYVGDIACGIF